MATTEKNAPLYKCEYGIVELPEGVVLRSDENASNDDILKWSGSYPIPQIGQRVQIKINKLGAGTVESYFVEGGYLGVTVRLDDPPEWKIRQHKGTKHEGIGMVFGIEITLL